MNTAIHVPARFAAMRPKQAAAAAAVSAIVGASVLALVLAAIAHAAGASSNFTALKASSIISLIVITALAAVAGWLLISARTAEPQRLLDRLVPIVVGLSLIPDLLLGFGKHTAANGVSWGGVVALMIMHLVVAAVFVTSLRAFVPPSKRV